MDKNTKVVWKKEDNSYLNEIFDLINLGLGFMVILSPIITSLICLFGMKMDVSNVLIIFYCFFVFLKIFYYSINFRFIKLRKLDILEILGISLLGMLVVTAIINKAINATFFFTLGYFLIFLTFIKIDKKYYKLLLYTFVLTIFVCSVMGVCDLHNKYMPGFVSNSYAMSLQFFNPNYSAYITIMAIVMTMYILFKYKTLWQQILFWIVYVFLNVALFINGCFSAETSLFVAELFLLLYLWIKNKKCPYLILIFMGISIAASFVWIKGISTSNANYMFESLAVIDNNLGTNLLVNVSRFFDKLFGTGVITSVSGSDGWDRADLKTETIKLIISNPKTFIFGNGAGANYDVRVHNVILQMWLEYGIISVLLYATIIVLLIVRLFKTKFSSHNVFLFALMLAVIVVCHYFGCLEQYSFSYYSCFLAVFVKDVNGKLNCKTEMEISEKLEDTTNESEDKNPASSELKKDFEEKETSDENKN